MMDNFLLKVVRGVIISFLRFFSQTKWFYINPNPNPNPNHNHEAIQNPNYIQP